MALPDYQLQILSVNDGSVQRIFDQSEFYDLRYSRILNDVGKLAFTLAQEDGQNDLFALDTFCELYRRHPVSGDLEREETYLARLTHRFVQDNEERFIVGAVSLNHLLLRRIVDPDDDPLAAGGYSTKAGAADTVMRNYALEQIGPSASTDRQMPGLTIGSITGTGINVGARLRHENLLEALRDLGVRGEMDFQIRRTTGAAMVMDIERIGVDRTKTTHYPASRYVYLTPNRGNLRNPSLKIDRQEEKNFCYALGQGQGTNRTLLKVIGDGTGDSPFNRIEFVEDIRNVEKGDSVGLLTAAYAVLRDNRGLIEFEFEPNEAAPGATYQEDFQLGDTLTVAWEDTEQDLRLVEVEIEIGSSGESVKLSMEPQ